MGEANPEIVDLISASAYDKFGQYHQFVEVNMHVYFARLNSDNLDDHIDQCVVNAHSTGIEPDPSTINVPKSINKKLRDYNKLRPFFGWLDADIIKNTFEHTTQNVWLPTVTTLRRAFRYRNPALNVACQNEAVACDIISSNVAAIDDGSNVAVLFVGTDTQDTDVYGIKTDKQFNNTLEDNITNRGAPHKLLSDSAQVLISKKVQDILRSLCIKSWQSEPHQQQHNPDERCYQTIKRAANCVLDRSGALDHTWLLCLQYVCYLLNHAYNDTLKGVLLQLLSAVTIDIRPLL
jgi:hypothetical protein